MTIPGYLLLTLTALLAVLFWLSPISLRRVRSGARYRVAHVDHEVPDLDFAGVRYFAVKRRVLGQMRDTLGYTHDLLETHGIPYWITCGTLLGYARHDGFIPWDDDIDVNIELADVPRLESLREQVRRDGYRLHAARGGFKLGRPNAACFPFVDIIVAQRDAGRLRLCYPLDESGHCSFAVGDQWPTECLPVDQVFPLQRVRFEDLEVSAPGDIAGAIAHLYGPDGLKRAVRKPDYVFPWLTNHYFDNLLYRLGFHAG